MLLYCVKFIKLRYTNVKPVLNSIPIKLYRVFLSHNHVTLSSAAPNISPQFVRKTAIDSFHVSCRSLLKRQGNLLPLDHYSYSQRF